MATQSPSSSVHVVTTMLATVHIAMVALVVTTTTWVFPRSHVAVCACAKCGSTSLFHWIYRTSHNGTKWPHNDMPWIQDLSSERWSRVEVHENNVDEEDGVFHNPSTAVTIALIRDPTERMVSAWKSKLQCERHADQGRVDFFMMKLFEAIGSTTVVVKSHPPLPDFELKMTDVRRQGCLYFNQYVALLQNVYNDGDPAHLEEHFRPQQHVCFDHIPPSAWTFVVRAKDMANRPDVVRKMALALSPSTENNFPFPHTHRTDHTDNTIKEMHPLSYRVLHELLAKERHFLRNVAH